MATDKEYKAVIDALSGECERLHKENKELKALSQEPTDTVSLKAYQQVCKERDIATEQLHELGYELGQKIEPCDDAISRQAVVQTIEDAKNAGELTFARTIKRIMELPSVTQKSGKWIPVSERLPDKLNDVLITFYDCPNEYDVAYLRTTFNESYKKSGAKNEWVSSMGETTYADYEVDAWMPIHPYKLESEE